MKKNITLMVGMLVLAIHHLFAQNVPQGINYQTIIRGSDTEPLASQGVDLRFQVCDIAGTVLYAETQGGTTNSIGLLNLIIGQGAVIFGTFGTIDWGSGTKTLKIALKSDLGAYEDIGAVTLMSVPYALYAAKSASAAPSGSAGGDLTGSYPNPGIKNNTITTEKIVDGAVTGTKIAQMNAQNGMVLQWNGNEWMPTTLPPPADPSATNEIQFLSLSGTQLSLSQGGGTISLPPDADANPTNEIQQISIAGNQLSLSLGGGTIALPNTGGPTYTAGAGINISGGNQISASDVSATNEIQSLALAGTTLSLSNGGGSVTLPAEVDGSVTNEIQALSVAGNVVSLSNGGGAITLPAEVDGSVTNEIQQLSITGNQLSLSLGGGTVTIPATGGGTYTAGAGISISGGNQISAADVSATNEIQALSLLGNQISLSNGGGSIVLPPEVDGSVTNEIQALSLLGNQISLSNGGGSIVLPPEVDGSVTNEIQALSLLGNQISLSNGGGSIVLPPEVDGSVTNEIQTLSLAGNQLNLSNGGGSVTIPAATVYTAGNGITITGANQIVNDGLLLTTDFDGDLSGKYNTLQIKADAVGGNEIAANAVNTPELADGAVSSLKILNGTIAAIDLGAMGATTSGQVLKWNGSAWAPGTDLTGGSGQNGCGQLITTDIVSISGGACPVNPYRLSVIGEGKQGMYVDGSGAGDVLGMRVVANGGSNSNDGILLLARSDNNESNGLKIAANSNNAGGNDITGLRMVAGGGEFDIVEDNNGVSQNYGLFIDVKDRTSNNGSTFDDEFDVGVFARVENKMVDWAGYFDGDIKSTQNVYAIDEILDDDLYITNPNNAVWRLDVNDGNNTLGLYYGNFSGQNSVGTFATSGTYTPSDIRLKEKIRPLGNELEKVLELIPLSYNYITDPDKKITFGFSAQETERLFPELTLSTPNDKGENYLGVNYAGFSVLAIKAVQEQQQIIEQQQKKIDEQELRLKALEEEMAEIRSLLKAKKTTKE